MSSWFFQSPPPPPPPPATNIPAGVALACLAAAMAATGINLQRLGKRMGSPGVSLLGVVLATSCGLADMASFQFAPQSLLAPFASLGLVVNLVCARTMHGESLGLLDYASTAMVIAGVVVCLLHASQDAPLRTSEELLGFATDSIFLAWGATVVILLGSALLQARSGPADSIVTKCCAAMLPGFFGGGTVLTAKVLTEAARAEAPAAVLAALGALAGLCGVSQTASLNFAVGKYSSLLVVPIFTATSLATNASGGGIFFQEFAGFSREQGVAYGGGVLLLLSGVLLLARKANATNSAEQKKQK